jgi:multiple sugar transport system substrate-binding protein
MEKKTAQFTSDSFINLLKQCKTASDKNLLGKASNNVKSIKMDSMSSLHSFNLIISAALMKAAVTKSPDNNKTFLCRLPTIDGKKSVAFNCVNLYAINKNSKNTKMAWDFIKFLLSDEMQSSAGTAFPVEKEAFKKKEKESFKLYNKNLSEKDITELVDKYHNNIENIISDINAYSYADPKINKIVEEEVKAFFTGQKSAENTAAAIQNKVNIYLNE